MADADRMQRLLRPMLTIRAFEEPLVLLLGGREKHLPLEEMAREAARRCRGIVFFGEAGPVLEDAVRAQATSGSPALRRVRKLSEAVEAARRGKARASA